MFREYLDYIFQLGGLLFHFIKFLPSTYNVGYIDLALFEGFCLSKLIKLVVQTLEPGPIVMDARPSSRYWGTSVNNEEPQLNGNNKTRVITSRAHTCALVGRPMGVSGSTVRCQPTRRAACHASLLSRIVPVVVSLIAD